MSQWKILDLENQVVVVVYVFNGQVNSVGEGIAISVNWYLFGKRVPYNTWN